MRLISQCIEPSGNSNVSRYFVVFLYGADTWRTTVTTTLKRWPEIISKERLWQRTCHMPVELQEIRQRRWKWIGHTPRKPFDSTTRHALTWNPGVPRITWRRDLETHATITWYSWRQLGRLAQDRNAWRNHVGGLCPRRGDEGFDWLIAWLIFRWLSNGIHDDCDCVLAICRLIQ